LTHGSGLRAGLGDNKRKEKFTLFTESAIIRKEKKRKRKEKKRLRLSASI